MAFEDVGVEVLALAGADAVDEVAEDVAAGAAGGDGALDALNRLDLDRFGGGGLVEY